MAKYNMNNTKLPEHLANRTLEEMSETDLRQYATILGCRVISEFNTDAVYRANLDNHMAPFCTTSGMSNLPERVLVVGNGNEARSKLTAWIQRRIAG